MVAGERERDKERAWVEFGHLTFSSLTGSDIGQEENFAELHKFLKLDMCCISQGANVDYNGYIQGAS